MSEKRILGIDYGHKRIGLAISDPRWIMAFPLEAIVTTSKKGIDLKTVIENIKLVEKRYNSTIERIIVGLPLHLSGRRGPMAEEASNFAIELEKNLQKKTLLFDERLTSRQAERFLKECGLSQKKQKQHVDKLSASIFLQSYLDQLMLHDKN